jgi:two-component system NtrC family sensor kinase
LRFQIKTALLHPEIHKVVFTTADGRMLADIGKQDDFTRTELITKTVAVRSAPQAESVESALTGNSSKSPALIGSVTLELAPVGLAHLSRNIAIKSIGIAFIFWGLVASLAYVGLRKATHSFNALMNGIETMRAGNFAVRINVDSDDEAGRAAQAVNQLAATLQERDRENARLHEELVAALRMEVQEEKKQLMAKLIQTNRMTSLGLLASSMAHEINNPNGAIRLANKYLSRACNDAVPLLRQIAAEEGDFNLGGIPFSKARGEMTNCIATIERSCERIAHVIQDLRSYSLGERNEFRDDVDIRQVISGAMTIVRAHGKYSGMTFYYDATTGIPPITGNHHQLEQVMVNLFLNAIQATPDGKGQITVYSGFDRVNNEVLIMIRDEGEGISPENMKHLIEPFYSTRIDNGGSGLGLFVTNFIVSAHKGQLEFTSAQGAGTTVTIRLPIHQSPSP